MSSSNSTDYPPSRYEDLKGVDSSISAFASKIEVNRIIRRNDDGTFPAISRPLAAQFETKGNTTREPFFSSIKPSNLAPALPVGLPLWKSSKTGDMQTEAAGRLNDVPNTKVKVGKLAISNPIIIRNENTQHPLNKIHTIDLAEAASNERMRREKFAQRSSTLVAHRPAPRPPSLPKAPSMVTTESQTATELERSESTKTDKTSTGLSVEGNASSTATLLSPGVEAVRRRSPRQTEPTTLMTPFKVIRPGEPIRIPIPRPPDRDLYTQPTTQEPVQTPLQRRLTTGLPSNPRAQTLTSLTKETGTKNPHTIMFVNNIVYNHPNTVGKIIQEVAKVPQPPDSGNSVVNRPRPIPRKGDKARQVFPAEISPTQNHKRSKSGGSLMSRKSILQLLPGSPTGLPSLPPIPQLAGSTNRAILNTTKSMTVGEKMNLLYSAPSSSPSVTASDTKRRSSDPDLPPISTILQDNQLQPPVDDLWDSKSFSDARVSRASKRTTVRTSSILGITTISERVDGSNILAKSVDTRNPADEVGTSWLPGLSFNTRSQDRLVTGEAKRRSSPIIPTSRELSMSTFRSETETGDEETVTNWGSVHSPVAAVSRQNARSTYIEMEPRNVAAYENIPIMMFDISVNDSAEDSQQPNSHDQELLSDNSTTLQRFSGQFHHRVGDECPSFSTRRNTTQSRKMPPPPPLLLNVRTSKRTIIIQTAEPSPMESPGAAYEVIQSQLRNFEQPIRDSVESPGRRLALLANLEQEMGQLETKWLSVHNHLDRGSMSSIQTSPSKNSRPSSTALQSSRPPSQQSSVVSTIAERRASQRAPMQVRGNEGTSSQFSHTSSETTPNSWQRNLAGTQARYMENGPELLTMRNNLNFLSFSKASLGSPSPPDTDGSESDEESQDNNKPSGYRTARSNSPICNLWVQRISPHKPSSSWLWSPQTRVEERGRSYLLPGLSIRPAPRKIEDSLTIESSCLWQSNPQLTPENSQGGLWSGNIPSQRPVSVKAPARPVTMRPPRKNKRITLLPDIVENPVPLPDRRDTLGIFQFPWGERSEHATMQYRPSYVFTVMPITMTAAVNPPRARGLVETEYSSSFFDEYDEEEGDDFSDFSGSGDDDFDETTLWEIASLLKTDQVPSKNSLLPMSSPSSHSIDASEPSEHITDIPFDDEQEGNDEQRFLVEFDDAVAVKGLEVPSNVTPASLWSPRQTSQEHVQNLGLPQNESVYWGGNVSEPAVRPNVRPRTINPELIQSSRLWSPAAKKESTRASLLWESSKDVSKPQATSHLGLWVKSGAAISSKTHHNLPNVGLPEPPIQTWQKLVYQMGVGVMRRSKPQMETIIPSINSSELWSANKSSSLQILNGSPSGPFASRPAMLWDQASLSRTLDLENVSKTDAVRIDYRINGSQGATSKLSGLWQQPVQVPNPELFGLFNPNVTDFNSRRTSKPPAVMFASRRPHLSREPLSTLTSHNLWVSQHSQQRVIEDKKSFFLWQGKVAAVIGTPALFMLSSE